LWLETLSAAWGLSIYGLAPKLAILPPFNPSKSFELFIEKASTWLTAIAIGAFLRNLRAYIQAT